MGLPWYKRDVDAWRGGTRGMSLELRGFYSELLDAMWDRQAPIPNDESKIAMMVGCNKRTVRKLLPQLVALGKIVETADGLSNARMAREIEDVQPSGSKRIRPEFDGNSSRIEPEFESKNPKKRANSTRVLEVEEEAEKEEEYPHQPSEQEAVRACEFSSDLILDVQKWVGGGLTKDGARKWLSTLSRLGTLAIDQAHAHTIKAEAQGGVRDPASYFQSTARALAAGKLACVPKLTAREALARLEAE